MALLRRCAARLLFVQTRYVKFREKCGTPVPRPTDAYGGTKDYVNQFQIPAKPNVRHASGHAERFANSGSDATVENELPGKRKMRYAELMEILSEKNVDPVSDPSAALQLLKNCRDMYPDATTKERRELVNQVWNIVEKFCQPLATEHYNTLLYIYAQNRCDLNADEFLAGMKAAPNLDTYRLLLATVAEMGDHVQASAIIAKIKEIGYQLDETMFASLLLSYSLGTDVGETQEVLSRMQEAMIEPGSATYCAVSRGFAAKGDFHSLRRVLKVGNLSTKHLMDVVKTLIFSGHGEGVREVMGHLPDETNAETDEVFHAILELIYSGKAKDAYEAMDHLPAHKTTPKSSVNFFFYEIVKSDTPADEIFEICNRLISSGKNTSALLDVTEAALRLKKEDTALLAFQVLRKNGVEIRPHFYWPLLVNAALNKLETDVIRLVKRMINDKVDPDYETLRHYVIPFLSFTDPVSMVRKLQDCGMKISELLTPALAFFLKKRDVEKAITLTDKIKGKTDMETMLENLLSMYGTTRDADALAKLLKNINFNSDLAGRVVFGLFTSKQVTVHNAELAPLISALVKNGVKISRLAADALKPRIMRLGEPKDLSKAVEGLIDHERSLISEETYERIPHPRNMTAEQLENHLLDLTAQGMNTRGVLRRLIQVYCGKNNLKKAEEFGRIFTKNGFQWTAGMISSMFSLYAANGLLDEADTRYKELRSVYKYFKIDDHKVIDFATALVKNGRLERASEVLSEQENVRTSPEIVRNCWRLLNAVAAAGEPENTKKTLNLLLEKRYCEISNHVLAPLIKTHLINGETKAAVLQFRECAFVYKKLPLPQELIRALLDASNNHPEAHEQIFEVLDAIQRIHGAAAADTHLVMALAVKNKRKELRKLLNIPRMNQSTLTAAAQKLADEKNSDGLKTILNTCRGIDEFDTSIIYSLILTVCSRSNDHETALEIWEQMKVDEVNPSPEFVEDLKNLLKSEKIPLPIELRPTSREQGAHD